MMDIANTKNQMYSKNIDHLPSFQSYQVFATYHLQLPPQFLFFQFLKFETPLQLIFYAFSVISITPPT